MKKVAFILYVGCVLAFSAFARAEVTMPFSKMSNAQAPVQIENVALDKSNFELLIGGILPNPCYQEPTATLAQDLENPGILILRLTSPVPTDVCVSKTMDFNTVVNLPVLAQNSQIMLNAGAEYIIKTDGNEFQLLIQGSDLMRVPGFIAN